MSAPATQRRPAMAEDAAEAERLLNPRTPTRRMHRDLIDALLDNELEARVESEVRIAVASRSGR